ncbi:uncharacterized protein KZ484_002099 [Pholidichthys leucotaenia]
MLDVVKMKEACRICARELCGNQRRWIFHPAAKLNLQVLLSHAVGRELTRDGRSEFVCSKCAYMLERMYRFDTVIARVEVLSLERLHKLLLEKERLRQCIGGLYRKNNAEECSTASVGSEDAPVVDLSALPDVRYSDMIQDDLAYSMYESWADREDRHHAHHPHHQCTVASPLPGQKPRRCRGCAALRVADSDYEAVCKVPRRIERRSTSCGPSTRYSEATSGVEEPARPSRGSAVSTVAFEPPSAGMETISDQRSPSPSSSVESLDTTVDVSCLPMDHKEKGETELDKDPEEGPTPLSGLEVVWGLLRGWDYRPVKLFRGSKLPVLVKGSLLAPPGPLRSPCGGETVAKMYLHQPIPEVIAPCAEQELQVELAEMEEDWTDDYVPFAPVHFEQVHQKQWNWLTLTV